MQASTLTERSENLLTQLALVQAENRRRPRVILARSTVVAQQVNQLVL